MTLILLPNQQLNQSDIHWFDTATGIIHEFEELLHLTELFGEPRLVKKPISGYTVGYDYGAHDFFFQVSFHNRFAYMGVLVKFSAQAFNYLQEQTNLLPYEVLQQVQSPLYKVRCSRIDIAVDYIDEGISINEIYTRYTDGKIDLYFERERSGKVELVKKKPHIDGRITNGSLGTLYFGKRESPAFLRIYDKKAEQIKKRGSRYYEAIKRKDWVRFECEFKDRYAHELTEALLTVKNDADYLDLLINFVIQKFYFASSDEKKIVPAPFIQKLIDLKRNKDITVLKTGKSQNTDLSKKIIHLLKSSGTIPTLFEIKAIWGEKKGLERITELITETVQSYVPNSDCKRFLKNNTAEYQQRYDDFDSFFTREIKPEIEK